MLEIASHDDMENVILETSQTCSEVVLMVEDKDYDDATEALDEMIDSLKAVKEFVVKLKGQ